MTLTEATKELKWVRTLLAELGYSNGNGNSDEPTDLFSDNQSASQQAQSASPPHVPCTPATTTHEMHIPPEKLNTKPLFQLLANRKQCFNSNCNLRIASFTELLKDYPSPEFPKLLSEIIQYGVKLGYMGPDRAKVQRPNHPSAKVIQPEVMERNCKRNPAWPSTETQ